MVFIQEIAYLKKRWRIYNKSVETHWIAFYVNGNNIIYFDSFQVGHIPKEIKKNHSKQKYRKRYLKNISIRFDNVWILLYWIF